ncbi:hypothetical protein MUO14_24105 [Halobacillus shinanisalinarum]|uniref:Uncharacterized protein n=1 Tax=Halobacillus shinanisalinarum TaxID=2932258 RepID=A0ABY4GZC1_9BACI|nr:hypothetical protein [Halobacillus shinanisalinarum]UOQ93414.1 hypothetical protein MUO14_24105 [Halobacillus shinanisalinarum]
MIDLTIPVYQALKDNAYIKANVTGGVHQYTIASGKSPPYIRIAELNNYDSQFHDNSPYASALRFQIDIWTPYNPHPIAVEVDKTMKAMGFSRTSANPQWDDTLKGFRKIMRYQTVKTF